MNKKFLFGMFAAAGMLLATSCQNDELNAVQSGNQATVSFALGLEGGVQTRAAIGDGYTVNELVWEVYDSKGNKVDGISGKEQAFGNTYDHTLNLTLAKGQTYTFAFWAHNVTSGIYNTENLRAVTMNYSNVDGNDEDRDAFFAFTKEITITGDFTEPITLKRPFAQLNLGVSDLEDFQKAGIDLKKVTVKVSDVANTFNVSDGSVIGGAEATFNLTDILYTDGVNTKLVLNTPIDGKTEFPWISMNYLLVNAAATDNYKTTVGVEFTLKTTHDDIVLGSANTPVQRNYRTNIIASLTSVGAFNIEISPMFDGEYVEGAELVYDGVASNGENGFEIFSAEGLKNASENLLTSARTEDIELSMANDMEVTNGSILQTQNAAFDVTIKGNGNTITSYAESADDFSWSNNYTPEMSTVFATDGNHKLMASDLTFTGTMSALMLGLYSPASMRTGEIEMNNVKVINAEVVELNGGNAPGVIIYNKNTTLNNCVVKGTRLSSLDEVNKNVYDVIVSSYASNTVLNDCEIGKVLVWEHPNTKLTVGSGTKIETIIVGATTTRSRCTLVVDSGAKVGTIDLSQFGDGVKAKVTIESGATVGKIIDANGVEYASIEAFNER